MKLNEFAPAVAGVVGGVTFTAAEITAMLTVGSLAVMMKLYNNNPEAFKQAYGAPAAAVAYSWQATKDLTNSMMGNGSNVIQNGKSAEELSKELTASALSGMNAHIAQTDPKEQAKMSDEINKYLSGLAGAAASKTLTPTQKNAISAMPAIANALPSSVVSDRTAEIIANTGAAATASTSAVRPDTTAASMPAAKALPVNAVRPDTTAASMPAAIPAEPGRNDVDITSDLPDVVSPPKTKADIARGGATGGMVGAPPAIAMPGATTGIGTGVSAIPNVIAGAKAGALARAAVDTATGGGGRQWKLPKIKIPSLNRPGLTRLEPKLINLNDPLNLKRNA